jgi:hypothetical protein
MIATRPIFAFFVALVITAPLVHAGDDASYLLRFKELGNGEVSYYTVRETGEVNVHIDTWRGGKLFPSNGKISEDLAFWEQVLDRPAGEAPIRVMRGYSTARYTEDGETHVLPMQGKRVSIDRHGDHYTYNIDGGPRRPLRHREVIEAEFTDDYRVEPYLPKHPVRINEVYAINGKPLAASVAKYSGMEFDMNRVEARGWLVSVYDNQGRRFGRVIADLRFPVTSVMASGKRMGMGYNDMMVLQTTFDICIDGSARVGTARTVTSFNATSAAALLAVKVITTGERTVTIQEPPRN